MTLLANPSARFKARPYLAAGLLGVSLMATALSTGGCASHTGSSVQDYLGGDSFLHFKLTVNSNGTIDRSGQGYYVILLNSMGEEIQITDKDTFTDFMRFDGVNFNWYTRQANQPNPGFTFALAGSLNTEGTVSTDGRSLDITFNLADSGTMFSQYIKSLKFTAHALTTDNYESSWIGRYLDFMGDDIDSNGLQTVLVSQLEGAINPLPTFYPNDPLNDWYKRSDLGDTFPYVNFDIESLQIYNSDSET